jgi:hypothetical protein
MTPQRATSIEDGRSQHSGVHNAPPNLGFAGEIAA